MNSKQKHNDEFLERIQISEKLFVVEGKKDLYALNNLGAQNVMYLQGPLFEVIEKIADTYKEAVLLTDLDFEGRKIYSKLFQGLTERGVRIDTYFREYLITNTSIAHIEGIDSYFERYSKTPKNFRKKRANTQKEQKQKQINETNPNVDNSDY